MKLRGLSKWQSQAPEALGLWSQHAIKLPTQYLAHNNRLSSINGCQMLSRV